MPAAELSSLRLPEPHLRKIQFILHQYVPQAEVWAYGSRVTEAGHEASDLDLVVRDPINLQTECPYFFKLKEALIESNVPIRVDIVDWARIPDSFQRIISNRYIVLQTGH
jgi:predicted nucleotidyltransferase